MIKNFIEELEWRGMIHTIMPGAKEQLENAQKEAAKYVTEAQKQQAEILREAAKMKTQIIEEAKEAATVEAKKVMDAAKVSIEQARKESEMQFRSEVSQFALLIADEIKKSFLLSLLKRGFSNKSVAVLFSPSPVIQT